MIVAQAPGVPYIWDKTASVGSKDVVQVINTYSTAHDLSFTSVK